MKINFFVVNMLAFTSAATDLKHLAPTINSGSDLSQTYWDQVGPIVNLAQASPVAATVVPDVTDEQLQALKDELKQLEDQDKINKADADQKM